MHLGNPGLLGPSGYRPLALARKAPVSRRKIIAVGLTCILSVGFACANNRTSIFEDVGPADELYAEGMKTLEGRRIMGVYRWVNYSESIELFQSVIDNYPYSEYAVRSELRIADAYFEEKRYDEALSYYRDFAELHPENAKVAYTVLQSALCHYNQVSSVERDQTATRAALLELEKLIRTYPYSPETRKGETILRTLRTRLARAEMKIGDFYLARKEFQSAAERYRNLLNTYPGLGEDAEALFKLGVCYENMKRQDEATRLFHVIAENFPDTELAIAAREHIAAAY